MVAAAIAAAAAVGYVGSQQAAGAQAKGATAAAGISADAQRAAIAESRRQYDQTRTDFAPYREIGETALQEYAALFGIGRGGLLPRYASDVPEGPSGPTSIDIPAIAGGSRPISFEEARRLDLVSSDGGAMSPNVIAIPQTNPSGSYESPSDRFRYIYMDPGTEARTITFDSPNANTSGTSRSMEEARSRFMTTPGYEFRVEEGVRALDRSAAARGNLGSGGYTRDLVNFGQGIAATEFDKYADRLAGLATTGQASSAQTAAAGMQSSAQVGNALISGAQLQGNALMNAATARASGYAGGANSVTGGLRDYAFLQSYNNQPSSTYNPGGAPDTYGWI